MLVVSVEHLVTYGAIRLHWLQEFLKFVISCVIPSQKTDDSALGIMDDMP